MAYETSNPPHVLVAGIGNNPTVWSYRDGDDDATVNGAGYFTDGVTLGMKVGDMVWVYDTATPKGSLHFVTSVSGQAATTAFAAIA
jgi:hypothetical protein